MDAPSDRALARELGRVLQLFSRVARAYQLYSSNHATLVRMVNELQSAFSEVLKRTGDITFKVRSDAFVYQDEVIFEEANAQESLPFVFYRDGIRRFDFSRGLSKRELEVLLTATVEGFRFSGFGDDIVSFLWQHHLEHIRYLVVDTTVVEAGSRVPSGAGRDRAKESDLDAQIEGLLAAIYGDSSEDVGPSSLHVDRTDLAAKGIADRLDLLASTRPEFQPPRTFSRLPSYADTIKRETAELDEHYLTTSVVLAALPALEEPLAEADVALLCDGLLRVFDASIVGAEINAATVLMRGVREIHERNERSQTRRWIEDALSEARIRQAVAHFQTKDEHVEKVLSFFRACGREVVPLLLSYVPTCPDPAKRRQLSDVALEIGVDRVDAIQEILSHAQASVVEEGLYVLARTRSPASIDLIRRSLDDPRPEIRLALLNVTHFLPADFAVEASLTLLNDLDSTVRARAARALVSCGPDEAVSILEQRIQAPTFSADPLEVKKAFLDSYAILGQASAIHVLARLMKRGEGLLVSREAEDLAALSAEALFNVRQPRSVEVLKKACVVRNKRLRNAARETLTRMKEAQ